MEEVGGSVGVGVGFGLGLELVVVLVRGVGELEDCGWWAGGDA